MSPPWLDRRVAMLENQVNALTELPARVGAVEDQLVAIRAEIVAMRGEIRTSDEETRRQMRVLHEEVISRIALLQEGRNGRRRPRSRARNRSKRR
jgi:hypothetical protein